MRQRFYIAIEGVIGVGKTTLARLMKERLNAEMLLEVFEANPFLSSFYQDRARYAFQTQIFFLLSRYRQQHDVIPRALERSALISDYSFAKDRLFAHLNLAGDELEMYERVHAILARNIPLPDLIIYLRADTDTLMQRIASRDRPYERDMSRRYIEDLRQAYEEFFGAYDESAVLRIDTDALNIVSNPADLNLIINQVRVALEQDIYQPSLLEAPPAGRIAARARRALSASPHEAGNPFQAYMQLMDEIGQLGAHLSHVWAGQERHYAQVGNEIEARQLALRQNAAALQASFSRSLKQLLALAEAAGADLDQVCSS